MTEIVCQISRVDFPEKWPRLLQVLAESLQKATEFDQLVVTLGTLEQLVSRYRHEMRSNRLWTEIILVVQNVAEPLTQLYSRMLQYLPNQPGPQLGYLERISWLQIVLELTRIYHSLIFQDLPEYFEVFFNRYFPFENNFAGQSDAMDGRLFANDGIEVARTRAEVFGSGAE
jgi:hypothetical protein